MARAKAIAKPKIIVHNHTSGGIGLPVIGAAVIVALIVFLLIEYKTVIIAAIAMLAGFVLLAFLIEYGDRYADKRARWHAAHWLLHQRYPDLELPSGRVAYEIQRMDSSRPMPALPPVRVLASEVHSVIDEPRVVINEWLENRR